MLNQKVRILIVEDDPDMAELISDLVEAEGWLPTCARSAEEADEILAKDVMQTGARRPQLARHLRPHLCPETAQQG